MRQYLALIVLSLSAIPTALGSGLELEIFVSEPEEINITSVLIKGPTEMMVMCAQGQKSSATRLADRIEEIGLELKYIFLSHAHLDHSQGAGILKERFPKAEMEYKHNSSKVKRADGTYE